MLQWHLRERGDDGSERGKGEGVNRRRRKVGGRRRKEEGSMGVG